MFIGPEYPASEVHLQRGTLADRLGKDCTMYSKNWSAYRCHRRNVATFRVVGTDTIIVIKRDDYTGEEDISTRKWQRC